MNPKMVRPIVQAMADAKGKKVIDIEGLKAVCNEQNTNVDLIKKEL